MKRFLDAFIRTLHFVCPSLFERIDVAVRSRVKYRQLRRNRPMDPNQVYDPERNPAETAEIQLRKIERWKRHLSRYARMYEKARFPFIDPPANDIFRKP